MLYITCIHILLDGTWSHAYMFQAGSGQMYEGCGKSLNCISRKERRTDEHNARHFAKYWKLKKK